MNLYEAEDCINNNIRKNNIVVVFCSCSVEYTGRAKSFLDRGDRLIIIKHDGNVIVHKPDGRSPVNWMPKNTAVTTRVENDTLKIVCRNIKPEEEMIICVSETYNITAAPLLDTEQLRLVGTERDMADMIYNQPSLISSDFTASSREEQTRYGYLDVFGYNSKGELVIVECKRYTAGLDSVTQLRRYVERVKKSKGTDKVLGVIAAPNISSNALNMLKDWGFTYRQVSPPRSTPEKRGSQKKVLEFLQ